MVSVPAKTYKSLRASSTTSTTQHLQPVPSSPAKKIKRVHLPDFSDQMAVNDQPRKKAKPKKKIITTSLRKKPRSTSLLSFVIQVIICYLVLAYFYFCPKDPTSNPFVCRNLAELHWAIEPHLSPYIHQFNHQFRNPLQHRVNRKLRPLYEDYLIPTWTHLQPQLSFALRLSQQFLRQSGLPDQLSILHHTCWTPVRDHVNQRYEEKLQPHIQYTITSSKRVYTVIRNSRFIGAIKTYLPHLQRLLLQHIIRPIQHVVLPRLFQIYQQYIQPIIIRLFKVVYQYLVVEDNSIKDHLKNIKLTYRKRVLRPVKRLHEIYVKPQMTKIALKLNEYQYRNSEPVSSEQLNTTATDTMHKEKSHPPPSNVDRSEIPDPVLAHSPSKMVEDGIPSVKSQATPPVTKPQPAPEAEEGPDEKGSIVPDLTVDEELELPEDNSSQDYHLFASEGHSLELGLEVDDDEDEEEGVFETFQAGLEDEKRLVEADGLTVDADDLMDEISHEIASEKDAISSDNKQEKEEEEKEKEKNERRKAEETAAERARLEKLAREGFAQMAALEKQSMTEFVANLREKRDAKNLASHAEIVAQESGGQEGLTQESKKLLERLSRWFERAEKLETVPVQERLKQAQLVVQKSKQKFLDKLVQPLLNRLDSFAQQEHLKEVTILNQAWLPLSQFSAQIQADLGYGFTWLADVTYHDWKIYHQFNTRAERLKTVMQNMIDGVASEEDPDLDLIQPTDDLPRFSFFKDIANARDAILAKHQLFLSHLDSLFRAHVDALSALQPIPPSSSSQNSDPDHTVENVNRDEL